MESNIEDFFDRMQESPAFVIDYLPRQVPEKSDGKFFDVEYYILNSRHYNDLRDRFTRIILKLMCYYHTAVWFGKYTDYPNPEVIENIINEIMENHSGYFYVVFPDEDSCIYFDWDSINMTAYNINSDMQELLKEICHSEGVFFRKAAD